MKTGIAFVISLFVFAQTAAAADKLIFTSQVDDPGLGSIRVRVTEMEAETQPIFERLNLIVSVKCAHRKAVNADAEGWEELRNRPVCFFNPDWNKKEENWNKNTKTLRVRYSIPGFEAGPAKCDQHRALNVELREVCSP